MLTDQLLTSKNTEYWSYRKLTFVVEFQVMTRGLTDLLPSEIKMEIVSLS